MEEVRLTIQVRDKFNRRRVTVHRDVALSKAAEQAVETTKEIVRFYKRQKPDEAEQD